MKITEKMYLLAKEIVQEYENNQEQVEHLRDGTTIIVKTGKTNFENKFRGTWIDEVSNVNEDSIKKIKNRESVKKEFSFDVKNCYLECYSCFTEDLRPIKEKDVLAWHDTIDKLNRIDKLRFEDIVLLVQAARNDAFWSKNFLSLVKLRRKNKDKVPYWKVFKEKFKFEKSKSESTFDAMNEVLKNIK